MLRGDGRGQQHQVVGDVVSEEVGVLLGHHGIRPGGKPVDEGLPNPCLDRDPSLLLWAWLPPEDAHGCDGSAAPAGSLDSAERRLSPPEAERPVTHDDEKRQAQHDAEISTRDGSQHYQESPPSACGTCPLGQLEGR